jgi:hypothetical protein
VNYQPATVLVFFHFAIEREYLPGFEPVLHVAGVEPDALDGIPTALSKDGRFVIADITHRHLEDGHTFSPEQRGSTNFADEGRHFPGRQVGYFSRVSAIFVAKWEVVEEVLQSLKAFCGQCLGTFWTDPFYVLYRAVELEHATKCYQPAR